MTLEPALVRALYRAVNENNPAATDQSKLAAALTTGASNKESGFSREAIEQLAAAFQTSQPDMRTDKREAADVSAESPLAERSEARTAGDGQSFDSDARQEWLLGRFLLNVQNEGSVAHRLVSFPIWFGDRLIEVEMAMFSQQRDAGTRQAEGVQYRKLVFSLNTEQLGHVEISVYVANRNLRVIVATDNEPATGELARFLPDLKKSLTAYGWQLDELSYRTTEADLQGNVIKSVVEHFISQDSLSRLM
jgi:hypothetical protein